MIYEEFEYYLDIFGVVFVDVFNIVHEWIFFFLIVIVDEVVFYLFFMGAVESVERNYVVEVIVIFNDLDYD